MAARNTPVTVLVGDDKHPFHLDEQQLCACSPFFRAVLTDIHPSSNVQND